MNYLLIDDKRFDLTDDGIGVGEKELLLTIRGAGHTFEEVKEVFENIGDTITIYGTVEGGDDFESGVFAGYSQLKAVNYDITDSLYTVHLIIPNDIEERIDELESAVNFLLMGGE